MHSRITDHEKHNAIGEQELSSECWVLGARSRQLAQQIEAFPDDITLWQAPGGITNPAGNLILHIEGNLREYIGRQLAGVPYLRDRPGEFSLLGVCREDLLAKVTKLEQDILWRSRNSQTNSLRANTRKWSSAGH